MRLLRRQSKERCHAGVVALLGKTIDRTCLSRFFERCAKVAGNLRRRHGFPLASEVATATLMAYAPNDDINVFISPQSLGGL
jgi:hypothetical protein